jgi:sepiapterin reductase
MNTFAILTGSSRGLGAALARGLLRPGTSLVTVARREDPDLAARAQAAGVPLTQLQADLSDLAAAERAADRIAALIPAGAKRYLLINNAGTVEPVAACSGLTDGQAIAQALNLNVTAVMMLTARFLQAVRGSAADRRVLNISSGAGRNAKAGWAVYCSTKAALDMYTRVLKLEQGEDGVRAVALAPGLIDTDMQAVIRASDPESFPTLAQFQDFKATGALTAPEVVAERLIAYLDRDDFGKTENDDIRNYH